ncbi:MAG: methyltransferase domain-containing protein [Deltaproteobacteria bacterium]|nr:methyltransferase domain-containing protein [Deltaproteobacteria bacterium]
MATDKFLVTFPGAKDSATSQDEEYCIVELNGVKRRIRFHDYHEIYRIPGLYEYLFCDKLGCVSPELVTSLLRDAVAKSSASLSELDILEIGAGSGIVGELLKKQGIRSIVGIDIVPEAAEATRRDRPSVYDDYYIADLENLSSDTKKNLEDRGFNCLVTVGALGFGDIHPKAFANAYRFIAQDGWIAFNIKEDFLEESDATGFSRLIREMVERGILEVQVKHRYRHRFSVDRRPLYYSGIIAKKKAAIHEQML